MGRTIHAYYGSLNFYMGTWGPAGSYSGRSWGAPLSTYTQNSTTNSDIGVAKTNNTDGATWIYPIRYEPTTASGWQGVVTMAANEVPTTFTFDGNGTIFVDNDSYANDTDIRTFDMFLMSGRVDTIPFFAIQRWIGIRTISQEGTGAAVGALSVPEGDRETFLGQDLWIFMKVAAGYAGRAQRFYGRAGVTISTTYICNAPATVTSNRYETWGAIKLSWSKPAASDIAIVGYQIYYQDSDNGTTWGNTTLLHTVTGANTLSAIIPPQKYEGKYRRYAVQTIANGGWANSLLSNWTQPVHTYRPRVTAGTVITAEQMGMLRDWRALQRDFTNVPSIVAQEDIVDADIGNEYRTDQSVTSQVSKVTANWYNNGDLTP